jgi:hypothetical protein
VDERQVSGQELLALQEWVKTDPAAPDGDWHKDFGSFLPCGHGQFPKTVLEKGISLTEIRLIEGLSAADR